MATKVAGMGSPERLFQPSGRMATVLEYFGGVGTSFKVGALVVGNKPGSHWQG